MALSDKKYTLFGTFDWTGRNKTNEETDEVF